MANGLPMHMWMVLQKKQFVNMHVNGERDKEKARMRQSETESMLRISFRLCGRQHQHIRMNAIKSGAPFYLARIFI